MQQLNNFIHETPFLGAFVTFFLGLFFMPLVLKIAKRYNFVVKPNKRTSHQGEIPNVGGLDIFLAFVIFFCLTEYAVLPKFGYFLAAIFVILIVGFIDDVKDLRASLKLVGEILAGIFLIIFADVRITNFQNVFGIGELPIVWSYLVSFFVYIAIINALNLIDGVDGLASGMGMTYSLFFAVYFCLVGQNSLALIGFGLAGSLAVFFLYNVFGGHKRKIFMGDSGSLLLGLLITYLVFQFLEFNANWNSAIDQKFHIIAAPAVAICVLFVPLFDTVRVAITRMKNGASPFKPDKNHIHHLLLRIGLKHRQITGLLICITLFYIGLAILCRNFTSELLVLLACVIGIVLVFYTWHLVNKNNGKINSKK